MTMYNMAALLACALSVMGYGSLFRRLRLPTCFFPITLVAGVSVTLYGFGFFAAMRMGSYAILLAGIALLAIYRRHLRSFLLDPSLLFCVAAGIWLYCITRGGMIFHWDEGSHWYRVCKAIYVEGSLPTTPDIVYHNYVPGCQTWIYYVLRFIDYSIPNLLFAQGLINIACVATLFAGIGKLKTRLEKGVALATVGAGGVVLCAMNLGTYALLVDLQLGLTAMALLIFLLEYGNDRQALAPAMLISAFLLLVKISAVFFLLGVFLWAAAYHRWWGKALAWRAVLLLAVPLLLRGAYSVRDSMVYADAAASPQTMSIEHFAEMFALKDAGSLRLFTQRFLHKLLIGDTGLPATVYIGFFLLAVLYIELRREGKREAAAMVRLNMVAGATMTAAYAVMLYATYLFTMQLFEILTVNCFYRYYGSMVIVFAGVVIYTGLRAVTREHMGGSADARRYASILLLFAVLAMPGAYSHQYIWGQSCFSAPENYAPSFWRTLSLCIPENRQYSGEQYVVFWNYYDFADNRVISDTSVSNYVGAWMRSENVDAISVDELRDGLSQEKMKTLAACDHLVFASDMTLYEDTLRVYLKEAGVSVDGVTIGVYAANRESGAN